MNPPLKLASSLTVVGVALSSGLDETVLAETPRSIPTDSASASDLQPVQAAPTVAPTVPPQPERLALPPEQSRPAPPAVPSESPSALIAPEIPHPAPPSAPTLQSSPASIPPTIVSPEKINPVITSTPVNDRVLSPQTHSSSAIDSQYQSEVNVFTPAAKGTYRLNQQAVRQVTSDGVRSLDYKADYILFDTPNTNRKITVERLRKIETLGQHTQFSLTGTCANNPNADPAHDQCVYTPGLVSDNSPQHADIKTGNPARIFAAPRGKGAAFDIATPANLEAIKAPGFQAGLPKSDPNSQQIGVDLTTPNLAITDAQDVGEQRLEETTNSPAVSLVRVRRVVSANRDRAQLAQTVRGISVLTDLDKGGMPSDNLIGTGVMGLAQLAPDVRPSIKGTGELPSGANENLFHAANSVYLPGNSFTAYHGGIGNAKNMAEPNRPITEQPATFNSVWIGVSPVVNRELIPIERVRDLKRTETVFSGGGEGGTGQTSIPDFSVLLETPDGKKIEGLPKLLSNFYSQLYLEFFKSRGNQTLGYSLNEHTRYVPSVVFTGSIATQKKVFQYYAGMIADPQDFGNSKAYGGAAYSYRNSEQRFAWKVQGQGVLGTDPDYYSYVAGEIAKGWQLGSKPDGASAFIGASALYSPDRPRAYKEVFFSSGNVLTLSSGINFGKRLPVKLTVDYTPGLFGENGVDETLTAGVQVKVSDRISVSGFYTPIAKSSSRSRAGANLEVALGKQSDSLRVFLGWTWSQYDLSLRTFNENRFSVGVQSQVR